MISVIICSANKDVLSKALESINATIGVPFETIIIENSAAKFGISEAYNYGAAKAKFDILCFMHEDICFETNNWGQKVLTYLQDTTVGLIGIAGGDTKSLVPSSWSSSVFESEISIIQHFKNKLKQPQRIFKTGYPEDKNSIKKVVCLDGVWMCTRQDVFAQYNFDSKTFKGFHGYDIDFSLQVFMQYKVCVVFDILIHHYSNGSYTKTWMQNMMLVSDKWKNQLPVSVRNLSVKEFTVQHWTTMGRFLDYLFRLNYNLSFIIQQLFKYSFNKYFRINYFLYFIKYAAVNYFKPAKQNTD